MFQHVRSGGSGEVWRQGRYSREAAKGKIHLRLGVRNCPTLSQVLAWPQDPFQVPAAGPHWPCSSFSCFYPFSLSDLALMCLPHACGVPLCHRQLHSKATPTSPESQGAVMCPNTPIRDAAPTNGYHRSWASPFIFQTDQPRNTPCPIILHAFLDHPPPLTEMPALEFPSPIPPALQD